MYQGWYITDYMYVMKSSWFQIQVSNEIKVDFLVLIIILLVCEMLLEGEWWRVYGNSLYYSCNPSVSLKLSQNIKI